MEESDGTVHEELWKSQEGEPMKMTNDEVCIEAHRREKSSARTYWVLAGFTLLFLLAFVRNVLQFHEPWLIAGTGWILTELGLFAWRLFRNGPTRIAPTEACARFLRRELEDRGEGLRWISWGSLFLFPAVVAMWLGGGPALGARQFGIATPLLLRLLEGPFFLIATALILAFVWFAFSREARKVEGEIKKLGQ
jgi:hypothetical protein